MPRIKKLNTTTVIVRNAEGEFLGVSRKDNYNLWGFAGGKCEKKESPEDCAKRELLEETGLVAEEMKFIDTRIYNNTYNRPRTIDTVYCYEITKYSGELLSEEQLKERGEGMIKWVGMSELLVGAFGNYNRAIFEQYYELKNIYLVEEHYDYEGSQTQAAFTNEQDAVDYVNRYAEDYNKRYEHRNPHYIKVGEGYYKFSGGTLSVEECPIDLNYYFEA